MCERCDGRGYIRGWLFGRQVCPKCKGNPFAQLPPQPVHMPPPPPRPKYCYPPPPPPPRPVETGNRHTLHNLSKALDVVAEQHRRRQVRRERIQKKYQNVVMFHTLVDHLRALRREQVISWEDMEDAVELVKDFEAQFAAEARTRVAES